MHGLISHNDANYQPLADLTWLQNKYVYAQRHGYVAFNQTENFITASSMSCFNGFEKIHLAYNILSNINELEWLWFTGTDSVITNFTIRIEDKIDNNYHFIICADNNGINADSILMRNSGPGIEFLQEILSYQTKFSRYWDTEQRAIGYILGWPGTSEPGWPTGENLRVPEKYTNIVRIVPQRYMNSYNYSLYPRYSDRRDKLGHDGNWQYGDWLLHWPDQKIDQRIQHYHKIKDQIIQ